MAFDDPSDGERDRWKAKAIQVFNDNRLQHGGLIVFVVLLTDRLKRLGDEKRILTCFWTTDF